MAHAMYIRLTAEEAEALHRLALAERRSMRDQAALVLAEALRLRGLLPAAVPSGYLARPLLTCESGPEGCTNEADASHC
jgi:hypothetical protein